MSPRDILQCRGSLAAATRPKSVQDAIDARAAVSTAPSHGHKHHATLAFHTIHNAAQLAVMLGDGYESGAPLTSRISAARNVAGRLVELLAQAGGHVGALVELLEHQEHTIEEQRVECLREKAYAARVEMRNSEHAQSIITLTRELDDARRREVSP